MKLSSNIKCRILLWHARRKRRKLEAEIDKVTRWLQSITPHPLSEQEKWLIDEVVRAMMFK